MSAQDHIILYFGSNAPTNGSHMFNAQDPTLIMKAAYTLKIMSVSWPVLVFRTIHSLFLALPLNLFLAYLSGRALYYVLNDTCFTLSQQIQLVKLPPLTYIINKRWNGFEYTMNEWCKPWLHGSGWRNYWKGFRVPGRNQTHQPHTLREEEPSQATWLTAWVLAAQTLEHLTSI